MSRTRWTIHGETVVDENRHIRLSTVDVELPDGIEFTQYVARMPACAMTLVLNERREALLMYRHRFIIDRWVWELPGGYVDHAEDIAAAAAREVEEETGWRPRSMEHLVTYQPAIGTLDHPQQVYLARGADLTDTRPDINEAEDAGWFPLYEAVAMIDRGEIIGAATIVALYRACPRSRVSLLRDPGKARIWSGRLCSTDSRRRSRPRNPARHGAAVPVPGHGRTPTHQR